MNFARRLEQIQPSQTLAITALVDSLRRSGRNIIDLGAGEPDFDTPEVIKEAAIKAIRDGFTKYTRATGILELKQAICNKLEQDNGLQYRPAEIIVTCGAKHAVINALLALCEEGDEVIIPSPYWTSYLEQVNFVGAKPIILPSDEQSDFKITAEQLARVLTSRTKLLIINSPNNPTGAVYTESEIESIAEVLRNTAAFILTDEIYEKIIYDGLRHVSLAGFPELRERVILVNGVSKAFAMTGWRIGYMAANQAIIKAVSKVQSHSTSNPCSISQKASIAALEAGHEVIDSMVQRFHERRDFLINEMKKWPDVTCSIPKGAFYVFPNVSKYFGSRYKQKTIESSEDFCSYLIEEVGVALVPGEAFGAKTHVRISYATSIESLQEASERIASSLNKLRDVN